MSRPSEGNYVIYNRILSPTGEKLAITYSGTVNQNATLTPLDNTSHQIVSFTGLRSVYRILTTTQWVLKNSGSTAQSISPQSATGLQAAWAGNHDYVRVQSAAGYVWNVKSNDDGYT